MDGSFKEATGPSVTSGWNIVPPSLGRYVPSVYIMAKNNCGMRRAAPRPCAGADGKTVVLSPVPELFSSRMFSSPDFHPWFVAFANGGFCEPLPSDFEFRPQLASGSVCRKPHQENRLHVYVRQRQPERVCDGAHSPDDTKNRHASWSFDEHHGQRGSQARHRIDPKRGHNRALLQSG